MEYGFPVLMLVFGAALLLYALGVRHDPYMIPRLYAAKITNLTAYAKEFAKVLAIIALSPVISGIIGLLRGSKACAISLVVTMVLAILICWLKHRNRK